VNRRKSFHPQSAKSDPPANGKHPSTHNQQVWLENAYSRLGHDGACTFSKSCPFAWGNLDTHLIHGSFGPPESTNQTIGSVVFFTAHGRESLYLTASFPIKIVPSHGRIWTTNEYMVLWAHPSPQPKRHLDRFSRFCRDYNCHTPTDRPRYSVCDNRPHLCTFNSNTIVILIVFERSMIISVLTRNTLIPA